MPSGDPVVDRGRWPTRDEWPTLLGAVVGVNVVGAAPALLAGPNSAWFRALEKPALYPPGWAFGVVWTILFTLLGVALYLLYRRGIGRRPVKVALAAFAVQNGLNVAWTPTFFALEAPLAALVVIVALWLAIVVAAWAAARVDRLASALYPVPGVGDVRGPAQLPDLATERLIVVHRSDQVDVASR